MAHLSTITSQVGRWHPGQLLMVWFALLVPWFATCFVQTSAIDFSQPILHRAAQVRRHTQISSGDRKRIADSARALIRSGSPPYEVSDYIDRQGLLRKDFPRPTRRQIVLARLAQVGAKWLAPVCLLLIPFSGFVLTWWWFGSRQKPTNERT